MLYKDTDPKPTIEFKRFPQEDYLPYPYQGFATKCIHQGQPPEAVHGSVNIPIHMTSTYAQKDIAQPFSSHEYTRCSNPTRAALEECLAALEQGKHAITFGSGCGATASIMHLLKTGDHAIICDDVYGGTQRYIRNFATKQFGIAADFVDMTHLENISKAFQKETRLVWIETPTNPTMKLVDIQAVIELTRKTDPTILIVVDNTFASPYLQTPLRLGADIAYNSLTKYLGGHSDVVMGALVVKDAELHKRLNFAAKTIGANPSPFDCYLVMRGIKTLPVRVTQATCNAYHVAHMLENHPAIESVIYPGLKTNPYHKIACKQMRGFGGMLSFRLKGGKPQASEFLKKLTIFTLAESLGGVESLAQCPAFMTHASVPAEHRALLGITDNLIRLSCGIESTADLIADISQALAASQKI